MASLFDAEPGINANKLLGEHVIGYVELPIRQFGCKICLYADCFTINIGELVRECTCFFGEDSIKTSAMFTELGQIMKVSKRALKQRPHHFLLHPQAWLPLRFREQEVLRYGMVGSMPGPWESVAKAKPLLPESDLASCKKSTLRQQGVL